MYKMNKIPFLFMFALLLMCVSCSQKSILVAKSQYDWKYFGKNPYYQTADLNKYESPNSREGQDSSRIVVVCASGGGTRAASFTMGILMELEKLIASETENRTVLNEIDYFSTTSGGGWGASSYFAYLYQREKYGERFKKPYPTLNSYEVFLANAADKKYDNGQLWYTFKDYFDGGKVSPGNYMEQKLNLGYLGQEYRKKLFQDDSSTLRLGDVFTLKNNLGIKPKMPMIIANTTNINNFMMVPFTPDRLDLWGVSQYFLPNGDPVPNIRKPKDTLSLNHLLGIPLTAGIKASSGVPGLIGTSFYYCNKQQKGYYLHLQDGGVVDNQGLYSARAVLEQEKRITDKKKRIVIMIDASPSVIKTARPQKKNVSRAFSIWQVMRKGTTDAPYPLIMEQLPDLEEFYNCTVIHLSTKDLLNPNLGKEGEIPISERFSLRQSEKLFYETYDKMLDTPNYYAENVPMNERGLLYNYIEKVVPSAVNAKGTNNHGRTIPKSPKDTKGSAKVMFLAGRAVVQLQKENILSCFK
jgi:hypothetical protein